MAYEIPARTDSDDDEDTHMTEFVADYTLTLPSHSLLPLTPNILFISQEHVGQTICKSIITNYSQKYTFLADIKSGLSKIASLYTSFDGFIIHIHFHTTVVDNINFLLSEYIFKSIHPQCVFMILRSPLSHFITADRLEDSQLQFQVSTPDFQPLPTTPNLPPPNYCSGPFAAILTYCLIHSISASILIQYSPHLHIQHDEAESLLHLVSSSLHSQFNIVLDGKLLAKDISSQFTNTQLFS